MPDAARRGFAQYWASRILAVAGSILLALFPICAFGAAERVAADRWVEIDLYWFDAEAPERSAAAFWDRYAPLYRNVAGYRGAILNIGFTVDHVMAFCALGQPIALPDPKGQELGAKVEGPLSGDTVARQAAWRKRFAGHRNAAEQVRYGQWTYDRLGRLAKALRREGERRGVRDFHVGSFVVAFNNAYGEVTPFARSHPEAWTRWRPGVDALDTSAYFDPSAALDADRGCFAGLPDGIAQGMPAHAAFAAQWGALSKAVGLDALMFRDGMGFPRAYTRYGPWGVAVPDRATADRITGGMAALLRGVKRGAPSTLTMMYSTAATATSDWRANGLDLETIARSGDLDIFVDQTWAGAWGEVGVRQQTFWNAPILGWTYQLGYLLQHRAMLSGTRVRHYFLTETFDAWESWNTIRTARERLRWGIWAWSHVAAKTPQGLEMTAGTYISWGNSGRSLIAPDDVAFLADTLDEAARDAAATSEIHGPTLVYSRDAFAAQLDLLAPDFDVRDRIDEQLGSIAKWGVPILSATRAEWVDRVSSDLFVFGATSGIRPAVRDAIVARARAGQPMAFFGAFGTAIDPAFLELAGAASTRYEPALQDRMMRAAPGAAAPMLASFAGAFDAPPPQRSNRATPADVVYGFADSVGLLRHRRDRLDIALWDPPSIVDYWYRPLKDNMNGDPAPYALAAATIAAQLSGSASPRLDEIDIAQAVTMGSWSLRDGRRRILAGNLEEGLRDDADRARALRVRLPASWDTLRWKKAGAATPATGGLLDLSLEAGGSALLTGE